MDLAETLPSSRYGFVLYICHQTMLGAFQCFSSCWAVRAIKAFSVFHSAPSASKLGLRKIFGVDRDGTVNQNSSNRYFLLYNAVPSNKTCAFDLSYTAVAWRLAWSGGRCCVTDFTSLVHLIYFLHFLNCLYYNLSFFSVLFLQFSSPIPLEEDEAVSEQLVGA